MKTRLTLRPGNKGTKAMERKYGVRLIAVRYLYDESRRRRIKTVELIEEIVMLPPKRERKRRELARVHTELAESELNQALRKAGAKWIRELQLWEVEMSVVERLGMKGRVVCEEHGVYRVSREHLALYAIVWGMRPECMEAYEGI